MNTYDLSCIILITDFVKITINPQCQLRRVSTKFDRYSIDGAYTILRCYIDVYLASNCKKDSV